MRSLAISPSSRRFACPFAHQAVISICAAGLLSSWTAVSAAGIVNVSTATELETAIANAQPGDEILLSDGSYALPNKVECSNAGTASDPIIVRASTLGGATLQFSTGTVEGFKVSAPYWTFENLDMVGGCSNHSNCEHAFHLAGDADFTIIRNNRVRNFNAQIKANGEGTPRVFPDDVLVENNEFFNDASRNTGNPVVPIDVVGGYRWLVRANFIHDFAKARGNNVSYAAFLKGNSRDGVFERNLVVCELLHNGQTRLGLSFGGGGTSPDTICEDQTCTPEHQNGIMRNNVIANCPLDVGIYINEGQNTLLLNNTIYNTTGIDFRFSATTGEARNNVLSGDIDNRNGATSTTSNNLENVSLTDFALWFNDPGNFDFGLSDGSQIVDQGMNLTEVADDYCGNDRNDGANDIGAVEYDDDGPCDTTIIHPDSGAGGTTSGAGGSGSGTGGAAAGGATASTGAGGAGAGTSQGAGGVTPDPTGMNGGGSGCSCHISGKPSNGAGWLLGLLVIVLRRRRMRLN